MLNFFKCKFFCLLRRARGSRHTTCKIVLKLENPLHRDCNFFDFLKWPPLPSWILDIGIFYRLTGLQGWETSLCQIFTKLVNMSLKYCDLSIFQDGQSRHLGFLKSRDFIVWWDLGDESHKHAKLVVLSRRYCDFLNFQDSCRRHLGFVKSKKIVLADGQDASAC